MDLRAMVMGLAFVLMWSSAFTSARLIVADASPIYTLSVRFFLSGAIAVMLARAWGQSWRLTRAQWRATVIFGLCQNALYLGLNFVAMQTIEASLAAIIASALPLMVAFVLWVGFREAPGLLGSAGLAAGFAGVGLIMGARLSGGVDPIGLAYCVLGAIALTVATLAVRGATSGGNVMMIVGLQMLVGGAFLLIFAVLFETPRLTPSWTLALAFAYTTFFPGLLATWVWFKLVNRIGATRAATFHFLNPVFAVVLAWVFLGETMSFWDLIGVLIVTAGILAVQLSRQSK